MSETVPNPVAQRLLSRTNVHMDALGRELAQVLSLARKTKELVQPSLAPMVDELAQSIADFSCPITLIGQVKAGKTALANALTGLPGLLPSDVNPWTSVATTLHLNGPREANVAARFTFFERDEWERLVHEGGRLGQMAERAGAEAELGEIRAQIAQMHEKSRARLGRNFELLLGSRHKYDRFDSALIERYVCLGDDEDLGAPSVQGRFADITRSADLFISAPHYPIALALRDTPGVNDPFLMREQITLRCLETSSVGIVVLTAAQAMNSVDLALIKMLSAFEGRRVIVFVNRIDDLPQPDEQIAQIRASLDKTLQSNGLDKVEAIIFGSARWAEAALAGRMNALSEDSADSLRSLAASRGIDAAQLTPELGWNLSGLGALQLSIGKIIEETVGSDFLETARRNLGNLVTGALAKDLSDADTGSLHLDAVALDGKIAKLRQAIDLYLLEDSQNMVTRLETDLTKIRTDFVAQAVDRLMANAKANPTSLPEGDTLKLRLELRRAFMAFSAQAGEVFNSLAQGTAVAFSDLYVQLLQDRLADAHVAPPTCPAVQIPTAIGRTIAIDLDRPWWKTWITDRLSANRLAADYQNLIHAEIAAIERDILSTAQASIDAMNAALTAFLALQTQLIRGVALGDTQAGNLHRLRGTKERAALEDLQAQLRASTEKAAPRHAMMSGAQYAL